MYVVQFSNYRTVEHPSFEHFNTQLGRWLNIREAENCYILGQVANFASQPGYLAGTRFFSVHEADQIVAGALLFPSGQLLCTWTVEEAAQSLADFMINAQCNVTSVFAP